MRIVFDTDRCYGCKTCQMVCSFHHTGAFWPEKASIKQYRNPQDGYHSWSFDSTCDGCKDEEEPLCLKYCVYGAIQAAI